MPKTLKQGEHKNLKTKVKNRSGEEFSGRAILHILDIETGRPIDGWFQNIFPQQYFTIEGRKSGLVHFDIHVPYTVSNSVKFEVVVNVGQSTQIKETIINIEK